MTRVSGRQLIEQAVAGAYALPAFNVSNMETTQAILAAAERAAAAVFLQLSPGAIAYAGYDTLTRLAFDLAERASTPVAVHLDHCRDVEVVERAIADGYDSVMFDGSRLAFDDNVRQTQRVLEAAAATRASVEAEIGVISNAADSSLAEARGMATHPDEAARFAALCPVDVLAPAIGTLHGMPDDAVSLDLPLIRQIARAVSLPLALHGGSGVSRDQLRAAIECGVVKVNVSSRVSRALAAGIREAWSADADQLDLRQFLARGRERVTDMASEYFALTGAAGRARTGLSRNAAWAGEAGAH